MKGEVETMAQDQPDEHRVNLPPIFLDGYFTKRFESGERPKYGYPTNHLPTPRDARMEIVTSFIASRQSK